MRTTVICLALAAALLAAPAPPANAGDYRNEFYGAPSVIFYYPLILGSPILGYERALGGHVAVGLGLGYGPEGFEGWASNGDLVWNHVIVAAPGLRIYPGGRGRGFFLQPEIDVRHSTRVERYDTGYYAAAPDTAVAPAFLVGWRWLGAGDRLALTLAPGVVVNAVGYIPALPRLDFFMGANF